MIVGGGWVAVYYHCQQTIDDSRWGLGSCILSAHYYGIKNDLPYSSHTTLAVRN